MNPWFQPLHCMLCLQCCKMCISSKETEKTLLSQRSLSLSIIQSRQNREAWRAQQHHSGLEILHFVLFLKTKSTRKVEISEANMFPTTSPVKDKNTVDVMSLGLAWILKGVITQGSMDSFMAPRHNFFQTPSKVFQPSLFLTWKGQQTQRRQTEAGLARCCVWHLFRHSRNTSESERSSASEKSTLDVRCFLWTDQW